MVGGQDAWGSIVEGRKMHRVLGKLRIARVDRTGRLRDYERQLIGCDSDDMAELLVQSLEIADKVASDVTEDVGATPDCPPARAWI